MEGEATVAGNMEVTGKIKIGNMAATNSDSILVLGSDGILGLRQSSSLNTILLNAFANKN
ncbi:MAG: hypothetical protein ACJA01_000971 [Saprospiraceae bacterium]